jgi:phosphatidylglycerophosphatase A
MWVLLEALIQVHLFLLHVLLIVDKQVCQGIMDRLGACLLYLILVQIELQVLFLAVILVDCVLVDLDRYLWALNLSLSLVSLFQ